MNIGSNARSGSIEVEPLLVGTDVVHVPVVVPVPTDGALHFPSYKFPDRSPFGHESFVGVVGMGDHPPPPPPPLLPLLPPLPPEAGSTIHTPPLIIYPP